MESHTLNQFQILTRADGSLWELGRGRIGITYKGRSVGERSPAAVKVLHPQLVSGGAAKETVLARARAWGSVRHPNVAAFIDAGTSEGRVYVASEWVEGESLVERVEREGSLPLTVALRIASQIAKGMAAGERKSLFHGAIDPQNVLLQFGVNVKLTDWGLQAALAALGEEGAESTGEGPGASLATGVARDGQGLGRVLHFMLCGFVVPIGEEDAANGVNAWLAHVPVHARGLVERLVLTTGTSSWESSDQIRAEIEALIERERQSLEAYQSIADTHATALGARNGYVLLSHCPTDQRCFRALEISTDRTVALRTLLPEVTHDVGVLAEMRRRLADAEAARHPNLLAYARLESDAEGFFVVSDAVPGFSLRECLSDGRRFTWPEVLTLAKPVAGAIDAAAERVQLGPLNAADVLIDVASDDFTGWHAPLEAWPPFTVKLDGLGPTKRGEGGGRTDRRLVGEGVERLATIVWELLGLEGTPYAAGKTRLTADLCPAHGAALLRKGATEPGRFASAAFFFNQLEAVTDAGEGPDAAVADGEEPAAADDENSAVRPAAVPASAGAPRAARPVIGPAGRLLRLVSTLTLAGAAAFFAAQYLVGKPLRPSWFVAAGLKFLPSSQPAPAGSGLPMPATERLGSPNPVPVSVDAKGEPARSPASAADARPLASATPAVGRLTVTSEPVGLSVELSDPTGRTAQGRSPLVLADQPPGDYTVTIRREGWPEFRQRVELKPGASVTVGHGFPTVQAVLRSDPSGAAIYKGEERLGETPLTVELPPQPVELTSRYPGLAPVTRQISPSPVAAGPEMFKHAYGTVSVTSDRPDAALLIGGVNRGTRAADQIVSPGSLSVVAEAAGSPSEQRTIDVADGAHVSLNLTPKAPAASGGPAPGVGTLATVAASPAPAKASPASERRPIRLHRKVHATPTVRPAPSPDCPMAVPEAVAQVKAKPKPVHRAPIPETCY